MNKKEEIIVISSEIPSGILGEIKVLDHQFAHFMWKEGKLTHKIILWDPQDESKGFPDWYEELKSWVFHHKRTGETIFGGVYKEKGILIIVINGNVVMKDPQQWLNKWMAPTIQKFLGD